MTPLVVIFALALAVIAFAYIRTNLKAFRLAHMDWDDLLDKVKPVAVDGISTVAIDYLRPSKDQLQIEPRVLWKLVGGLEGLSTMYANAELLIALASQAQQWNLNESVVVAERMRSDASALRRATLKLAFGAMPGYIDLRGSFYVQEAASAYYLMRGRLLALYETSHAGRYPRLAAAV